MDPMLIDSQRSSADITSGILLDKEYPLADVYDLSPQPAFRVGGIGISREKPAIFSAQTGRGNPTNLPYALRLRRGIMTRTVLFARLWNFEPDRRERVCSFGGLLRAARPSKAMIGGSIPSKLLPKGQKPV
jgi:hypothetical protein